MQRIIELFLYLIKKSWWWIVFLITRKDETYEKYHEALMKFETRKVFYPDKGWFYFSDTIISWTLNEFAINEIKKYDANSVVISAHKRIKVREQISSTVTATKYRYINYEFEFTKPREAKFKSNKTEIAVRLFGKNHAQFLGKKNSVAFNFKKSLLLVRNDLAIEPKEF